MTSNGTLHELNDLGVRSSSGFGRACSLLDAQACVIAALPMKDQFNLVVDDLDDNLFDKQPDYLFTCLDACSDTVPCLRKITIKLKKPLTLFSAQCNERVALRI